MSGAWPEIERVFAVALETPPAEREALLEAECPDESVRAEVRRLLARHDSLESAGAGGRAGGFLDSLDFGRAASLLESADEAMPETIGRFRVVRPLGRGSSGAVWLARDPDLDRRVAIKLLSPALSADPAAARRFAEEARAVGALDHPRVVAVYETGRTEDGRLFLAMAYHEGGTLREHLAARGALPAAEVARIAAEIAEGLAAAHAHGIVHRDVKPENVLLTARGACLLDFGIAKVSGLTLTGSGTVLGTMAYMSPEQTRGERVDHRTDLWSLGVVLHEMLAGTRPFRSDGAEALVYGIRHDAPAPLPPGVPPALAAVVGRCLAKDPEERFRSAREVLAALEGRQPRRHAALRSGAAAACAAVAALVLSGDAATGRPPVATASTAASSARPVASRGDAVAWDLYSRAMAAASRYNARGLAEAERLLAMAVARDSNFVPALAKFSELLVRVRPAGAERAFRRARPLAARALALDPSSVAALRAEARIAAFYDHDWAGAERRLQRALALDSTDINTWNQWGAWLSATGRADSSWAMTRRAVTLDPGSVPMAIHLGGHLFWMRRYTEALAVLERAVRVDSASGRAHLVLGRVYSALGRHDEAIRELRRPGEQYQAFESEALLAYALGRAGRRAEARRMARELGDRALAGNARPLDVAAAWLGLGDTTRALDWLERVPDDRGSMHFLLVDPIHDPVRGSARFRRVLERLGLGPYIEGPRASAGDGLTWDLYLRGREALRRRTPEGHAEGESLFRAAIARDSNFAPALVALATFHTAQQTRPAADAFRQALPLARRALALDSTLAGAHRVVGWHAMLYERDWPRAERHLRRALALDPTDMHNYNRLAVWLMATGDLTESFALLRRSAALDPTDTYMAMHLGHHLFWQGRHDEAAAVLERSIAMDSTWEGTQLVLGRVYAATSRWDEAIRLSRRPGERYGAFSSEALLAWALGRAGRRAEAQAVTRELERRARAGDARPIDVAAAHLGLGDTARALDWLERVPDDPGSMHFLLVDPMYEAVRGSARFRRVVERLGLGPYLAAVPERNPRRRGP